MKTLRQEIGRALEEETLDLRQISKRFGLREREVLDHLEHIARSRRLEMEPAQCRRCGFLFKKRGRLNAPSRCPVCRSESIAPPRYRVED